jgi:hypothetical protein
MERGSVGLSIETRRGQSALQPEAVTQACYSNTFLVNRTSAEVFLDREAASNQWVTPLAELAPRQLLGSVISFAAIDGE